MRRAFYLVQSYADPNILIFCYVSRRIAINNYYFWMKKIFSLHALYLAQAPPLETFVLSQFR